MYWIARKRKIKKKKKETEKEKRYIAPAFYALLWTRRTCLSLRGTTRASKCSGFLRGAHARVSISRLSYMLFRANGLRSGTTNQRELR